MVSEKEILEAFDLYLSEENLELYDLSIVDYPSISRVEVYIVSDNGVHANQVFAGVNAAMRMLNLKMRDQDSPENESRPLQQPE